MIRGSVQAAGASAVACAVAAAGAFAPGNARADQFVRSPQVNLGEYEFEMNGEVGIGPHRNADRFQSYTYSLAATPFDFLRIEIEAESAALPGNTLALSAMTLETYWQVTEPGEYWLDLGAFAEFSRGQGPGSTNTFTVGPELQKDTGGPFGHRWLHTLNLFVERDVGRNATPRTGLITAFQTRLLLDARLQPGLEIFGGVDDLGRARGFNTQSWQAGPVIVGAFHPFRIGKIAYELGYQFGISDAAPSGAVRWKFEYEWAF